jgi:glycerophosphoryl diester phosphodiesterase
VKTIIAGPRNFNDYNKLLKVFLLYPDLEKNITEIVSGKAKGVDTLGERWARENKIPIKSFPADWNKYGNSAGPIRNLQMANYADALIALWDDISKGTGDMIEKAKNKGLKILIYYFNDDTFETFNFLKFN